MPAPRSKNTYATLAGHLLIFSDHNGPHLGWSGWCPFCRAYHRHAWHETRPEWLLRTASHRVEHCNTDPGHPRSPFIDSGYLIRLDPERRDEHMAVLEKYSWERAAWWTGKKARLGDQP